jgi:HK97 family phage prohead protease
MSEATKNQAQNIEIKRLSFAFEVKAISESDDEFTFEGYASTYGNIDRVGDICAKGCFDDSLKMLTPKMLWMHQWDEVIGVYTEIKSDDYGLFVKGKMPKADTLVSGRVIPQMKIGSVRSMSVGFSTIESKYDESSDVRTITKAKLFEISLVDMPANPSARVTDMKKYDIAECEKIKTKRDFEKLLRESGAFSNKSAVYLASHFREEKTGESEAEIETKKTLVSEMKKLATAIKKAGV